VSYRVLIAEDNRDILDSIVDYLEIKGLIADATGNGKAALELIDKNHYDLLVLDIGLPGMDGLTVCQQLRQTQHNPLPVIMLTARDTLEDRMLGFESGTDDYLIKPFSLRELHERIKAILKRFHRLYEQRWTVGRLAIDVDERIVSLDGEPLKLDRKSYKILELLMKRWPGVVSHEELHNALWGDDPPDSNAMKTHIYRVRQALLHSSSQQKIHNVPGMGYKLAACEN